MAQPRNLVRSAAPPNSESGAIQPPPVAGGNKTGGTGIASTVGLASWRRSIESSIIAQAAVYLELEGWVPMRICVFALLTGILGTAADLPAISGEVFFSKQVPPILQRSCQNCHYPNGVAPMP